MRPSPLLTLLCLGYLIDFFDLTIFAASRLSCLASFGITGDKVGAASILVFNTQVLGVFIGGLTTGLWGDKIGRTSAVRYGIFLFSTATFLNAFVTDFYFFVALRFLACIGLAGEFATCATMITEFYNKKQRSLASGWLYASGVLGGILAALLSHFVSWRVLFMVGGGIGFLILMLRIKLMDAQFFLSLKAKTHINRGNPLKLLFTWSSFKRVFFMALVGVPFWYLAYLVNFSPELSKRLNISGIQMSYVLFAFFVGGGIGTLLISRLSYSWQSRKKPLFLCFALIPVFCGLWFLKPSAEIFYLFIFMIGLLSGYPGLFAITAAEQFGSNQRVTATSIITNTNRVSLIGINSLMSLLGLAIISAPLTVLIGGVIFFLLGTISLLFIKETFHSSVDFIEN